MANRVLIVGLGLFVAHLFAGGIVATTFAYGRGNGDEILSDTLILASLISLVTIVPSAALAGVAEKWAIQNWIFYPFFGVLVGYLPLLIITPHNSEKHLYAVAVFGGAFSGLIYWLIAGRRAGS